MSTAEAAFNVNTGGQDYGSSVLKLVQGLGTLSVSDYFTPYNEAFLSQWDLDLSSCGVVALPDQPGANPHLLVASGKQGTIYLLNRDNMGQFNSLGDSQIVQELPSAVGAMFSTPAYWNNAVYFAGNASPIKAFSLSSGLLATPPMAQSVRIQGGHAPTISANGNANGVLWVIAGGTFYGFDATTLKSLYNTNQAGTRDTLSATAHFATQTVANGRVYIGTKQNLMVYGLLPELSVAAGNNQSVTVNTILPVPLQVQAVDPYSGQTFAGVTVTFSDGGKGGTFSNSTVVTDGTRNSRYQLYPSEDHTYRDDHRLKSRSGEHSLHRNGNAWCPTVGSSGLRKQTECCSHNQPAGSSSGQSRRPIQQRCTRRRRNFYRQWRRRKLLRKSGYHKQRWPSRCSLYYGDEGPQRYHHRNRFRIPSAEFRRRRQLQARRPSSMWSLGTTRLHRQPPSCRKTWWFKSAISVWKSCAGAACKLLGRRSGRQLLGRSGHDRQQWQCQRGLYRTAEYGRREHNSYGQLPFSHIRRNDTVVRAG